MKLIDLFSYIPDECEIGLVHIDRDVAPLDVKPEIIIVIE